MRMNNAEMEELMDTLTNNPITQVAAMDIMRMLDAAEVAWKSLDQARKEIRPLTRALSPDYMEADSSDVAKLLGDWVTSHLVER